jgi:thiol-disulfide isomerase/thioredoxin
MTLLKRRTAMAGGTAFAVSVGIVAAVMSARKPRPPEGGAEDEPGEMRKLTDIMPVVPPLLLPPLTFQTLDGGRVSLAEYRGRATVLNLWATWCGPCVKEMPALDRLAAQQGPGGIAVLAVSADRGGAAAVRPFLAAHAVPHLTVLLDPGSDGVRALGAAGFPTTLIIDAEGRLRGRLEGPAEWGSAAGVVSKLTA